VAERRTGVDFAPLRRRLVGEPCPGAEEVVLVPDNLSTHTPAALCQASDPAEARRRAERPGWHYTPKHGSWRAAAECELSVRARPGPGRRIPGREALRREVAAWGRDRNAAGVAADWPFTTADARLRLKRRSPVVGPAT
jgi:hypothetical protein